MDKLKLLDVNIDVLTIEVLNCEIKNIIESQGKEIIANHNLHSIYLLKNNPDLEEFWEKAYLTHVDGMPLIWWGNILGYSIKRKHRITYLDWIYPLFDTINENKWSVFYLGGKPGIADTAVDTLKSSFQSISFETQNGFFNVNPGSIDNKKIVNKINSFSPNVLMVGMGMPRQERWILQNFENLDANVILNCGACFDYIAGEQKTPPRVYGRLGLEWLYRFINDPKRLFERYFVEPFGLLPLFLNDLKQKIT